MILATSKEEITGSNFEGDLAWGKRVLVSRPIYFCVICLQGKRFFYERNRTGYTAALYCNTPHHQVQLWLVTSSTDLRRAHCTAGIFFFALCPLRKCSKRLHRSASCLISCWVFDTWQVPQASILHLLCCVYRQIVLLSEWLRCLANG